MKARFFCDGCGAAVGARADRCPACGKAFSAVRCPQCGYEGKPSEFVRGCRVCGYLAPGDRERSRRAPAPRRPQVAISRATFRLLAGALALALVALTAAVIAIARG